MTNNVQNLTVKALQYNTLDQSHGSYSLPEKYVHSDQRAQFEHNYEIANMSVVKNSNKKHLPCYGQFEQMTS